MSNEKQNVGSVSTLVSSTGTVPVDQKPAAGLDLNALRLSQDFTSLAAVKKETLRVPVTRPNKQFFFWVHTDPAWRFPVATIETAEDREHFIVSPALLGELQSEIVPKVLVTCQTRQGTIFLWPIRLPGPDGRIDTWNESAFRIVTEYSGRWLRLVSNREAGSYDAMFPIAEFPAPTWPSSFDELLGKALRDRVINAVDHPVIQKLRGVI